MKHVLAVLVIFFLLPQVAEAKLYAKHPLKVIECNSRVELGVTSSPQHKGSRNVRVQIKYNTTIFYQRVVKAPLGNDYSWQKQLRPCGKIFTISYFFSKEYVKFRVLVRPAYLSSILTPTLPLVPDTPSPPLSVNVTPITEPSTTPTQTPSPTPTPTTTPIPTPTPTPSPILTPTPTPTPTPEASTIQLQSGTETQLIRMIWWRGPPAIEGDFRVIGSCVWAPDGGNCVNGAPPAKTFRPQHFFLSGSELWMDMPQYVGGAMTFSHYPLPITLTRTGCTFQIRHARAGGRQGGTLEFVNDPPGLEILPHIWTMTGELCTTFDPLSQTWVNALNAALAIAIPPGPYIRPIYPY